MAEFEWCGECEIAWNYEKFLVNASVPAALRPVPAAETRSSLRPPLGVSVSSRGWCLKYGGAELCGRQLVVDDVEAVLAEDGARRLDVSQQPAAHHLVGRRGEGSW